MDVDVVVHFLSVHVYIYASYKKCSIYGGGEGNPNTWVIIVIMYRVEMLNMYQINRAPHSANVSRVEGYRACAVRI